MQPLSFSLMYNINARKFNITITDDASNIRILRSHIIMYAIHQFIHRISISIPPNKWKYVLLKTLYVQQRELTWRWHAPAGAMQIRVWLKWNIIFYMLCIR